jgi:hypothetical protein
MDLPESGQPQAPVGQNPESNSYPPLKQLYNPPFLPTTFDPHTYLDATPLLIKKGAPKKQFALHFAFFGSLRNALGRFGVVIFDFHLYWSYFSLLVLALART